MAYMAVHFALFNVMGSRLARPAALILSILSGKVILILLFMLNDTIDAEIGIIHHSDIHLFAQPTACMSVRDLPIFIPASVKLTFFYFWGCPEIQGVTAANIGEITSCFSSYSTLRVGSINPQTTDTQAKLFYGMVYRTGHLWR